MNDAPYGYRRSASEPGVHPYRSRFERCIENYLARRGWYFR